MLTLTLKRTPNILRATKKTNFSLASREFILMESKLSDKWHNTIKTMYVKGIGSFWPSE